MGNERGNITGKGGDEYGPKGEHRQRAYRERKTNRIIEEVVEVLSDEISNDDDLRRNPNARRTAHAQHRA